MTRTPQDSNPYLLLSEITDHLDTLPSGKRNGFWIAGNNRLPSLLAGNNSDGAELVGTTLGPEVQAVAVATTSEPEGGSSRVHLITRNGEEYLLQRDPKTGQRVGMAPVDLDLGGRPAWAARRTLELPSHAPVPSIGDVRQRAIAAAGIDMLLEAVADGGASEAAKSLCTGQYYTVVAIAEMRFGLSAPDWGAVHQQALRQARAIVKVEGAPTPLSRYLEWCDAPMWANHVDDTTPSLDHARAKLLELVRDGHLTAQGKNDMERVFLSARPNS